MTEQNNLPENNPTANAEPTDETQPMPEVPAHDAWTQPLFTPSATQPPMEQRPEFNSGSGASPSPATQQTSYNDYKAEQRRLKAAWKQQQRASKAYAREASHNGYPGSAAPQEAWGGQYASQYTNQYVSARPIYRKGPNVAAIVWGGILLLAGAIALVWFLVPSLFVSANIWAILLSIGFAVIGLSLVIGAIVTSFSEMRRKRNAAVPSEDDDASFDDFDTSRD